MSKKVIYPEQWWSHEGLTPPPTEEEYVDPPEEEVVRIVTRIVTTYLPKEEADYEEHDKPEGHIYLDLLELQKGLKNHELHKTQK
jgi:hypothetical protein|tara:strand:- start:439 stop:693 length:255 start_codon:yes stop_codon:yes gene_type:complete